MNRHINTQLEFNQHEFHWYPMSITQGKTEFVCQELDERGIEYILPSHDVESEEKTSDLICTIDVNHIIFIHSPYNYIISLKHEAGNCRYLRF